MSCSMISWVRSRCWTQCHWSWHFLPVTSNTDHCSIINSYQHVTRNNSLMLVPRDTGLTMLHMLSQLTQHSSAHLNMNTVSSKNRESSWWLVSWNYPEHSILSTFLLTFMRHGLDCRNQDTGPCPPAITTLIILYQPQLHVWSFTR